MAREGRKCGRWELEDGDGKRRREGKGGVTGKTNGRLAMASLHSNITLSVPLPWVESPVKDAS